MRILRTRLLISNISLLLIRTRNLYRPIRMFHLNPTIRISNRRKRRMSLQLRTLKRLTHRNLNVRKNNRLFTSGNTINLIRVTGLTRRPLFLTFISLTINLHHLSRHTRRRPNRNILFQNKNSLKLITTNRHIIRRLTGNNIILQLNTTLHLTTRRPTRRTTRQPNDHTTRGTTRPTARPSNQTYQPNTHHQKLPHRLIRSTTRPTTNTHQLQAAVTPAHTHATHLPTRRLPRRPTRTTTRTTEQSNHTPHTARRITRSTTTNLTHKHQATTKLLHLTRRNTSTLNRRSTNHSTNRKFRRQRNFLQETLKHENTPYQRRGTTPKTQFHHTPSQTYNPLDPTKPK